MSSGFDARYIGRPPVPQTDHYTSRTHYAAPTRFATTKFPAFKSVADRVGDLARDIGSTGLDVALESFDLEIDLSETSASEAAAKLLTTAASAFLTHEAHALKVAANILLD